ncbi:hypothetical protein SABIM44S_02003 [Streptomyces abikoensis]
MSGVAQLSASASQGTYPVASVQYYVDGEPVSDKVTKAPYGFAFDSASVPDGKHILTVEATDTAGTTGTTRAEIITTNGESNSTHKADFNGDGKADIGILYNGGEDEKGVNHTALWTLSSNGKGFDKPVRTWESVDSGSGSWNWNRSKPVVGDFDGDGKADVSVLYNQGQTEDGRNSTAVWKFTSNGAGVDAPAKVWDSIDSGTGSWNWKAGKLG